MIMLSKNDLIFLGACMFLINEDNWKYPTYLDKAIDVSKQVFNKVFDEKFDNDEMILE